MSEYPDIIGKIVEELFMNDLSSFQMAERILFFKKTACNKNVAT